MKRCHVEWVALVWVVCYALSATGEENNRVEKSGENESKTKATITQQMGVIRFQSGTELVTEYHIAPEVAKPYFYPLLAKGGVPVTRDWPMKVGEDKESRDHVHQKSGWFCYGDIVPEGLKLTSKIRGVEGVDFWSEAKGHGKIVCKKVDEPKGNRITTYNEWQTASGETILNEVRTIELKLVGENRLLILEIELIAKEYPILFADTKEGALGLRVHDQLTVDRGHGILSNAKGDIGEKKVWGYLSNWCDYSGKVNGKEVGVTIFDDEKNPYRSVWHSRNYGLSAANPFGRKKSGFPAMKGRTDLVRLAKGEKLKLRYGILLHPGNAQTGKVAESYTRFMNKN